MKKGDVVQQRLEVPQGKSLMHGFSTLDKAQSALSSINQHYNLPASAVIGIGACPENAGQFAILALEDTYVTQEAKVRWVVDNEVSLQYAGTGGYVVLDMNEEENEGWVVIKSAPPTYQSDVEHMTDEQLRESIEALRGARIAPRPARARSSEPKAPPMSTADKKMAGALGGLTAEAKLELKRKLGLI